MRLKRILLFGGVCLFVLSIQAQSLSSSLHPKREFRAAWIQTVHGHFRDMPTRQLQDTLLVMLDSLRQVGMNAVIFQVRPEADTFYSSELEPWSRFLTGEQGEKAGTGMGSYALYDRGMSSEGYGVSCLD